MKPMTAYVYCISGVVYDVYVTLKSEIRSFHTRCQVPTKITRGQIEITTEVFLVPKGSKVRTSVLRQLNFCFRIKRR